MLFDINNIIFDELTNAVLRKKKIKLIIARLDKLHPVVSGNKLFKLHYFLEKYKSDDYKTIQTFGGAFSNHLVATAFACNKMNIPCKAVVRGERPPALSHTLQHCLEYGMLLEFVSREAYASQAIKQEDKKDILCIPEGGYHPLGAKGASLMADNDIIKQASHICLPVGTATTLAGILQRSTAKVIAVPVLKGLTDIEERLKFLNNKSYYDNLEIWDQFHFGGYAKKTAGLINFMNDIYKEFHIPTDFIYTGKMMYAILDGIYKDLFPAGSEIVCLHTGGLQGNWSLPSQTLIF